MTSALDLGTMGGVCTVHSQPLEVAGERFTAALVTPRADYDRIAAVVIPTIGLGACP